MIMNPVCTIDYRSQGFVLGNGNCIHYMVQSSEYTWEMNTLIVHVNASSGSHSLV
jgi:hypothetical protein